MNDASEQRLHSIQVNKPSGDGCSGNGYHFWQCWLHCSLNRFHLVWLHCSIYQTA